MSQQSICSAVWIAVGHQGFQLGIYWKCGTQYCTATHSLLWTSSVKMTATVSAVTSEHFLVTKPRSSLVSGEWYRVLAVYLNCRAESQGMQPLEPAINRKIWSPGNILPFRHHPLQFLKVPFKSEEVLWIGSCWHALWILFRGASEHKSEDDGERIDTSEGCHILNTDFFF